MKDLVCVLLMGFIMISNLVTLYETRYRVLTPLNTSIIWDRDSLNRIVEARKLTITNNIITSIVNGVINEAEHARTKFEWKDMEMIVDNSMYNTVINKLKDIFQNVTFEEYLDNELIEPDENDENCLKLKKNEVYSIRLNWE
jgi:phenylalanyl-tRNA synthetase alpha subunit